MKTCEHKNTDCIGKSGPNTLLLCVDCHAFGYSDAPGWWRSPPNAERVALLEVVAEWADRFAHDTSPTNGKYLHKALNALDAEPTPASETATEMFGHLQKPAAEELGEDDACMKDCQQFAAMRDEVLQRMDGMETEADNARGIRGDLSTWISANRERIASFERGYCSQNMHAELEISVTTLKAQVAALENESERHTLQLQDAERRLGEHSCRIEELGAWRVRLKGGTIGGHYDKPDPLAAMKEIIATTAVELRLARPGTTTEAMASISLNRILDEYILLAKETKP